MRTLLALTAAAAVVEMLAGCSANSSNPSRATAVTVQETLGPGEVALPATEKIAGHFSVRLLLGRCGITLLTGTHAEFEPKNPLCRIHERVASRDASYHSFSTSKQRLILRGGAMVGPSIDAMNIKRQPDIVNVGGHDVIEIDVYFEPPPGSAVDAVRFYGDADTGKSVAPPGPPYVDLPTAPALRENG